MSAAAADPLAGAEILVGHRELMATFHELARELEEADPAAALEAARGAVAFLRHAVVPFGRHEEALLGGAPPLREDRGLFAAALDPGVPSVSLGSSASHPSGRTGASAKPRAMGDGEVAAFLAAGEWGVLSTVPAIGGVPYAVPVGYGWDGRALFFATGGGRKADHLDAHPFACLTVSRVESGDRWRCVVASGPVQPVPGLAARARAAALIARNRSARPTAADLARLARARVFRLVPAELTGRARG